MTTTTVWEAYLPSGTEQPDRSQGLFTGYPDVIKEFVLIRSASDWDIGHVALFQRKIMHLDAQDISDLKTARDAVREAKERLAVLEGKLL